MRSVLVCAWVGSTNVGDELVFASVARKLRARAVEPVAVSLDVPSTTRHHSVRAIGHLDVKAWRRTLSSVDAVLLGGGGLLQDSTSPFNLPYHLARPVVARRRGRPVGAIALGAGPLRSGGARWMVRRALQRVRPITVRDDHSRSVLAQLGVEASTTADLAFGLEPPATVEPDRLVACLRPWSSDRHLLPVSARRPETPDWFTAAAAQALDDASGALGLPVHFVALQRDRDHQLHVEVARRMRAAVSFARPTVHTVLGEIARGAVVVSMRYHGVVGATLAGRPSVAIGYSPKVDSLAADLGAAARLVPWSREGIAAITQATREVAAHSADAIEARERLRERERGNDDAIDQLLSR